MFTIACVSELQERKNRFPIGMHGEDFDALDRGNGRSMTSSLWRGWVPEFYAVPTHSRCLRSHVLLRRRSRRQNVAWNSQCETDIVHDVIQRVKPLHTLNYVMNYVCLALGVPGNILSAIIWLRRHVTTKNSSAVYLAVLAISDLVYLLDEAVLIRVHPSIAGYGSWVYYCIEIILIITEILEPLFVFSFSVERLIVISCPLQVRCKCVCVMVCVCVVCVYIPGGPKT